MYLTEEEKNKVRRVLEEILDGDIESCTVLRDIEGRYELDIRGIDSLRAEL